MEISFSTNLLDIVGFGWLERFEFFDVCQI